MLRHKQKALLQASEIKEAVHEAIPHLSELLQKFADDTDALAEEEQELEAIFTC